MPSHDGTPLLEARGLQRSFGRVRILRGIDLSIHAGEALVVIGPNGAGKTTLLRVLAGLLRPDGGEVRVLGRSQIPRTEATRRAIGLLSHQSLLYDDLTLLENLVFAARLHGLDRPLQTAQQALGAADLSDRASQLPRRLSRGLQQRAAVARALLHSPRLLLLDEPFTALDSVAAGRLGVDFRARLAGGAGLVLVTHNLAEVWDLASRIAVLVEGRLMSDEPRSGTLESFLQRYQRVIGG